MGEYKENIFIRFLRWFGIIRTYSVSKEEMCKQAINTCDRQCGSCAWYEREVHDDVKGAIEFFQWHIEKNNMIMTTISNQEVLAEKREENSYYQLAINALHL